LIKIKEKQQQTTNKRTKTNNKQKRKTNTNKQTINNSPSKQKGNNTSSSRLTEQAG
jgi:hypothetical protein